MEVWQALILGIVEGLTEFLPISSTFHLIFTSKLLMIETSDFLTTFEVFIQAGAILAILFLYMRELWADKDLVKKIIISFIPTAIVGLVLHSVIKQLFFNSELLMLSAFILVGLIFIIYEWWLKNHHITHDKEIKDLSTWQAVIIGCGQALAVIPGVSRAGAVMLTMMLMKEKRSQAAKYSFLLALPTICAAAALDIFKLWRNTSLSMQEVNLLAIGSLTAFVSAFFVLKWFISFLQRHTLTSFGIYRLLMAALLFTFAR